MADAKGRPLSLGAVELVFQLCEQPRAEIAGHVLGTHFQAAGDELVMAKALLPAAPGEAVIMPVELDDDPVEFAWEPDLQAHAAFHPTAGWIRATPQACRRYRLDFDWLLAAIADAVGVPASARSICLVADRLWDLGDAWLGRRKASVLFARRLSHAETLDAVCDALTRRVGRPPGVLLTTTRRVPRHVAIPGQHRVLWLAECLRGDAPGFALDADVLSGVVSGLRPQRPAQLIDPSPDFRIVRALGRTFHFRGDKQRRVIEYLYLQWRDGNDRVSVAELVAELELPAKTRIRDLFKKHPAWGVLLTEEHGSCRFLV